MKLHLGSDPWHYPRIRLGGDGFLEGMIPKEITAIVTVLCSQRVVNEREEVVLQNDHPAAGDYARAVAISEL